MHEVAQQASPAARVVYADIDQVAVAHSKAMLAGNQNATVVEADVRDPERILTDPAIGELLDFRQPTGLLLVMVLHFIADADDPWRIVARLRDALAPGSHLVLGHLTTESKPDLAQAAETVYNRSVSTDIHMRSRADILRFFDGFEPSTRGWSTSRSGGRTPLMTFPPTPGKFWCLVGVGRKP